MIELTHELRDKFLKFKDEYDLAEARLKEQGASGFVIANGTWAEALSVIPLAPDELRLYKQLVAMHSVNGGELFGTDEENRDQD